MYMYSVQQYPSGAVLFLILGLVGVLWHCVYENQVIRIIETLKKVWVVFDTLVIFQLKYFVFREVLLMINLELFSLSVETSFPGYTRCAWVYQYNNYIICACDVCHLMISSAATTAAKLSWYWAPHGRGKWVWTKRSHTYNKVSVHIP